MCENCRCKKKYEIHSISDVPEILDLGRLDFYIFFAIFLYRLKNKKLDKKKLAELACKIEMHNLKKNSANKINTYQCGLAKCGLIDQER